MPEKTGSSVEDYTIRPWYKTWWGILGVLIIWPIFVTWYAWEKSNWSNPVKIAVTIVSALYVIYWYLLPR